MMVWKKEEGEGVAECERARRPLGRRLFPPYPPLSHPPRHASGQFVSAGGGGRQPPHLWVVLCPFPPVSPAATLLSSPSLPLSYPRWCTPARRWWGSRQTRHPAHILRGGGGWPEAPRVAFVWARKGRGAGGERDLPVDELRCRHRLCLRRPMGGAATGPSAPSPPCCSPPRWPIRPASTAGARRRNAVVPRGVHS